MFIRRLWQFGVEKQRLKPDLFSLGMKQDSLLEALDGPGAFNILSEIENEGLEPNSGHYGRAIMGFVKKYIFFYVFKNC